MTSTTPASAPASPASPAPSTTMPVGGTAGALVPAAHAAPASPTAAGNSLLPSSDGAAAVNNANNNRTSTTDVYGGAGNGMYGSSGAGGMYGAGGYGMMDPYGYGAGGMYGMGGMGMYGMGGMGMMGLGGMGMMGMGMLGMTPEAQRSQMMMFMISRMVELWGMFSQVVQAAFVSVIQFADNYVGIHQRMGALEDEAMNNEEQYKHKSYEHRRAMRELPAAARLAARGLGVADDVAAAGLASTSSGSVLLDSDVGCGGDRARLRQRHRRRLRAAQPSFVRRVAWSMLRHGVLLLLALLLARRLTSWWQARQASRLVGDAVDTTTAAGVVARNYGKGPM